MKTLITFAAALFVFSHFSIAGAADERKISKGSVLNYLVKEGAISYKLKATVMEWNTEGNIKIQWQTTGAKAIKGVSTFPYSSLESATEMKIKLKPGNETLTEDISRWFAAFEVYDYLYNFGTDADLKIDDIDITLYLNEDETEKEILYNNVKTAMNYAEGENTESGTTIGFIEYTEEIIILDNYVTGSFSMKLVSIQSPLSKNATKPVKTEEVIAREILDALAPKGAVPLKKMEPVKFAKVKSNYPLLATVEDFDATKGGTVKKPITETYEYRYGSGSPNPPSLIDCFTADLKIIYNQRTNFGITDITETISTKSLPSSAAKRIIEVYLAVDYNKIPGYRPWSHWSFVKSLTESQRTQLATELQGYITEYGFNE
jgi:hypothetical protein